MLKKIIKWLGIIAAGIIVFVLIVYSIAYFKTESRANQVYDVAIQRLHIPSDSASLVLGAHISAIRGCSDCHAGGGTPMFDEKNPVVLLHTANLTKGEGGIAYTNADWIRALRHGVGKDGKSLWFMPSQHTSAGLSNNELGALIAYLKQLSPINHTHPKKEIKPLGRMLTFFGQFPLFTAEAINHNAVFPDEIKPAATAAYGKYLAVGCMGCHGDQLKGGPAHEPGQPTIPDISNTSRAAAWSNEQFITVLHKGKTPGGKILSDFMPWKTIGAAHTEEELTAIYLYLHQLK